MRNKEIRPFDRAYGRFQDLGSAAVQHVPILDRWVGRTDNKLQVPMRWFHVPPHHGTAEKALSWLSFKGNSDAGQVLPKNFNGVARLSTARAAVEAHESTYNHNAVAYRLGTTMMVGVNADMSQELFNIVPGQPNRLEIGMRVGRGTLQAAIGMFDIETKTFLALHDLRSQGDVVPMDENTIHFT